MEFSETLGFFKILTQSTKLVAKNGRFMAPITLLSLLLPSILLLFFTYFYQFITNIMVNSITDSSDADSGRFFLHIISYILPLLSVEIAVMFLYILVSRVSGIATVLTSATSYTGNKISLRDLIHRTKKTWKSQRSSAFRTRLNDPTRAVAFIGAMIVTPLVIFYPNPITIAVAVALLVAAFAAGIYSGVVTALSNVVSVVEEVESAAEARERGEGLVRGQRQYGIMVNLFLNVVCLAVMAAGWVVLGGMGVLDVTGFGLLCVNLVSVVKILGETMYTVFYFECRKFHGEDVDVVGSFEYSKLPAADDAKVGSDMA